MANPPPYNTDYEKAPSYNTDYEKPQYPPANPQAPYPPQGQQYPQNPQYPQGQQYPQNQQYYPQGQQQYPAGPQGYGQQYPAPVVSQPVSTTNVIVHTGAAGIGPNPVSITCPHCQAQIVTSTESSAGSHAWLVVLIVTLIACFVFPIALLGCCFIPLCIPELRDVEHTCPNCRKQVGKYTRKF